MIPASRLHRLTRLVQADLDALPDRPIPPKPAVMFDDEDSGGVSLDPPQPLPAEISKQTVANLPTKSAPVTAQPTNTERRFILVEGVESSYNMGTKKLSADRPGGSAALPATGLSRGELAAARDHFTPVLALAKYPYKFCNKSHSQDIASAFFDAGKFWNRPWDLYYIWDVEPTNPIILVRESQFHDLLNEINNRLNLGLKITDAQRAEGLVGHFPNHPACLPRYLGRSNTRDQYDSMVSDVPDSSFRAAGERSNGPPDSGTLEQFKKMMEDLWDAQQKKNKAKKAEKMLERIGRQTCMVDQLKRAQRYLGLRAANGQNMSSSPLQAVSPMSPAPFNTEQSVVFVCVDVESYERAHNKITEIGVATLDTQDLVGIAPGPDGDEWRKIIKARHFRIKDHLHLINHEFVHGCPDGFDFGVSTVVDLKEAPAHVAACFKSPFGAHASNNTTEEELVNIALRQLNLNGKRNLVLLGHDTLSDVRYLQQLGYDPMKVENIIEAMDTAKMYQAWRREPQPTSLGRIMNDFDIAAWKLHNAGNDAVYTVRAMLAICVREASIRGSTELEAKRNEDKAARIAAVQEAAAQRVKEDMEGWSDGETAGDGGGPVPLKSA
ncbi:hypothetical protein HBI71_024050 [Parastagonospora nodorum]|nr:hypothetical protein HBI71_024050 [Parastagonospora nodorum]